MWFPGQSHGYNPNQKIGVSTLSMWGLCFVAIGVCYYIDRHTEQQPTRGAEKPANVHKVLPSGAWLMDDGSVRKPGGEAS